MAAAAAAANSSAQTVGSERGKKKEILDQKRPNKRLSDSFTQLHWEARPTGVSLRWKGDAIQSAGVKYVAHSAI